MRKGVQPPDYGSRCFVDGIARRETAFVQQRAYRIKGVCRLTAPTVPSRVASSRRPSRPPLRLEELRRKTETNVGRAVSGAVDGFMEGMQRATGLSLSLAAGAEARSFTTAISVS